MIELADANELTRRERFCGWYHTHPFDVDVNSHCYLSTTDISTQLQWQRSEDPHGNPWLAIVIDPLRSLAKGHPELMAFRVYPPDYNPPLNETPDGKIILEDRLRLEKWGACWNRYYRLEVSYFMSNLAQTTLGILKNNFLWTNSFTSTPLLEPEHQQRQAERISHVAEHLETQASSGFHGMGLYRSSAVSDVTAASELSQSGGGSKQESHMAKTAQSGTELALEQCQCCVSLLAKNSLFGHGMNTTVGCRPPTSTKDVTKE